MKTVQTFFIFFFLGLTMVKSLQLTSASTSVTTGASVLVGSIFGGTTIYIKGIGFPSNPNSISILIGTYPCNIPADGLTPTTISCQTSSSISYQSKSGLQIKLIYNYEVYTLKGYTFTYSGSDTPYITDVIPSSARAGTQLGVYGVHRVNNAGDGLRNTGDFVGVWAGIDLCDIMDIQQDTITYTGYNKLKCNQAKIQESGRYNISELVKAGWAYKEWRMQRASLNSVYFEHTVLPAITEISKNEGSISGQEITIKGTGFSNNKKNLSVSIDGIKCDITNSDINSISCKIGEKNNTLTTPLLTNSTTPTNSYISGSGFKYEKYRITNLINKSIDGFRSALGSNSSQITLIETGVTGELESVLPNEICAQVFKGFFYAPVSGNYIFRGAADDYFALYLSKDYGAISSNMQKIIYGNYPTSYYENYYIANQLTALGSEIFLEAGKHYYMELYHMNIQGYGQVRISAEVPNSNEKLARKSFEVNKIRTSATFDPELMKFTLDNVQGGEFNLSILRMNPSTLQVEYKKEVTLNYNASCWEFENALKSFDLYDVYDVSCESTEMFGLNGTIVNSSSEADKFVWNVKIEKFRYSSQTSQKFTFKFVNLIPQPNELPIFTETRIQNHSPLISGNFTLSIGGTSVLLYNSTSLTYSIDQIPFNVTASTLQQAFRRFQGFSNTEIVSYNDPLYGATWVISYYEYAGDVSDITVSGSGLSGGKAGTSPNVQFSETRKYSPNIIFNPIDETFLFSASSMPNILVTSNELLSLCLGNCSYRFITNLPEIVAQTLNGSIVNIKISNPTTTTYSMQKLTTKLAGQNCVFINGTFNDFYCQLPVNSDGSPILIAGNYNSEVFLPEIGYITIAQSTPQITYNLQLLSLTPSSGGINGGYITEIIGLGFPSNTKDAKITICNKTAQIIEISNILTKVYVPPCENTGIQTVTYLLPSSNQSSTLPFTYTPLHLLPKMFSISPQAASPVLKNVMTIRGQEFGTNISAVKVYLCQNDLKIYEMRVLELSDSMIKCGIPGGLPGHYKVEIIIDGTGSVEIIGIGTNNFDYELMITEIEPNYGSYYGGTLIKIKGHYFSTDILENLVHIGNELNWLCKIFSVTSTEILCRTPPVHSDWNQMNQSITITNRLIQDTVCNSNNGKGCNFNYWQKEDSPILDSISLSEILSGNGTLTLTGNNLNKNITITNTYTITINSTNETNETNETNSTNETNETNETNDITNTITYTNTTIIPTISTVILLNKLTGVETIIIPTILENDKISINFPNVESGTYGIKVRVEPLGDTRELIIKVKGRFITTSFTGSVKGGYLSLVGNGLPEKWPSPYFTLEIISKSQLVTTSVISSTPSNLTILIPPGSPNQTFSISLTNPLDQVFTAVLAQQTAATPLLTVTSLNPQIAGPVSIKLNRTRLSNLLPTFIQMYHIFSPDSLLNVSSFSNSSSLISFNISLKAGQYKTKVYYLGYGWGDCEDVINIGLNATYESNYTVVGLFGGQIKVSGKDIHENTILKIGGAVGKIIEKTATEATFSIPALVTPLTISAFPSLITETKLSSFVSISDSPSRSTSSFDNNPSTFYSSSSAECYIGIDLGEIRGRVTRLKYFPNYKWVIAAAYLREAVFEGSKDGINYTVIGKVDGTVHAGWNSIKVENLETWRYIRLRHNEKSACELAELEIYGIAMNSIETTNINSTITNITIYDGYTSTIIPNILEYSSSYTPIIKKVKPNTGSIYGGEVIELIGQYLNIGIINVKIDSVDCVVNSNISNSTNVFCKTGARASLPLKNTFDVRVGGNFAITEETFVYVQRWTDVRTWGTDLPPVEGDLIYVPKGMTLYVDESTPRVEGIVVEGKIIFADEKDMEIKSGFITVNGGEFIAGNEGKPYVHKLTFTMFGDYYGKQQPMFGNKGIGCMNCKFSMYGKPRVRTWTELSATINMGALTFNVSEDVDWEIGEEIVVASTDFDHNQAEQRKIVGVLGRTFTVDRPFEYQHFSGVENYANYSLPMRAEVGLLTRNIKVQGDPTSEEGQYGSHVMMTGDGDEGLIGQIAYTEFTKCGQPRIVGRYCIHFHMAGDVPDSFVKGNAVHHSFARILTIHGIRFLVASHNVGYYVKGHNFFIEDGIETQNTIENNLVISSLETFNMMQTDISVASYWITNPSNTIRNNRAAGGDFYGFWYEIKERPDGPSATEDVCPIGNPLGEFHDNIAHSYKRFGLRIFKLYSRQIPCSPIRNDNLLDPWSSNPSIESRFYNFIAFKNGEAGLLAEQVGNMIFENFSIAENGRAGMEFYVTNFTKELVEARNSLIIGLTQTNPPTTLSPILGSSGIIAPRSSSWKISNVHFQNFPSSTNILQTCSHCNDVSLYTNSAHEYLVEKISYANISGLYLSWIGMKRDIVYDLDGSFSKNFDSKNRSSSTVVYNYQHLRASPECVTSNRPSQWTSSLLCDETVQVRRVMFTNIMNVNTFDKVPMKVQLLSDLDEVVLENSNTFTQIYSLQQNMEPMIHKKRAYALPFIAGRIYNIWWLTGLDFTHLSIEVSDFFEDKDPAIIFKFNYTQNRELFEIGHLVNTKIKGNYTSVLLNDTLDSSSCLLGDYTHDLDNQTLTVCTTNRGKIQNFEYLDINGIKCRYICPEDVSDYEKEAFIRYWSNATQWPGGVMPKDGDNVTVKGEWTLIMDMQPAIINHLRIEGDVIVLETLGDIKISSKSIWIRSGSFRAGSVSTPHPAKITFELLGNKTDKGIVIDELIASNKLFVITGKLELYGEIPGTVRTRLTSIARSGDTSITVENLNDWKIGDELTISPSFSSAFEHEKVTIVGIASKTITFSPALKYTHYGANSITINNTIGTLDTRASVGHLTRNFKIVSGSDSGWGFHLLVYGYLDGGSNLRSGSVVFQGVEIYEGGQYDTENSAIKLYNTVSNKPIKITGSSIHNCKAVCLDIININNAEIKNNIFYQGRLFIVKTKDIKNYQFENNLMIFASKRPTLTEFTEIIACYATYTALHEVQASIKNNICAGSEGHGFILPYVPCDQLSSIPYQNNIVSSALIGWVFNKVEGSCMAVSGIKAFACEIAQIASSPSTSQLIFEKFIIADSNRGVTLRFGREADDNTAIFRDSFISAISRPNCSECYGNNATKCKNARGVRMLAVTVNGETLPMTFGTGFDVICKQESFDSKAFIQNVVFENFNQQYGELSQCSSNVVFEPHALASDMTGSHHLSNTVCNNCSAKAWARFTPPNINHLGWFGGCGNLHCTGKNNYIVMDHTGHFLGSPSFLLANNTEIGNKTENCTFISEINGHHCKRFDFGVIEYESIAPDFNTRIMWPVYLKFDGGLWNSTTNGWREWEWFGSEPLNRRLGRFVSVVQLSKVYNITFESEPPVDIRFQFQRRTLDSNNDFIVIRLHYPRPNSIRIQNRGIVVKPITLLDNSVEESLNTSLCGSNKFFYQNYTISFVLTGNKACQVRVSLTNSIQLTARFSMDINDFFIDDGQTKFIDRMCAILGIVDTSRLKIVGIYNGSVIIKAYIDEPITTTVDNATLNNNTYNEKEISELNIKLNQLLASGELSSVLKEAGLPLLSMESTLYFHYDTATQSDIPYYQNSKSLIIGLSIGGTFILALLITGLIYSYKKNNKIVDITEEKSDIKINEFHTESEINDNEK